MPCSASVTKIMKFGRGPASYSSGPSQRRIIFFVLATIILVAAISYRLFTLTFINHESLTKIAKLQYQNPTALISGRGNIYFSDFSSGIRKIAATNKESLYVYATTALLTELPDETAIKLSGIIGGDREALTAKLSDKTKAYQVISTDISQDQSAKIKNLKIKGIGVATQINRTYPAGHSAGQTLGFVGFDGKQRAGQYGIEAYYDDTLAGTRRTQDFFGNQTYSKIIDLFRFFRKEKDPEPPSVGQDGSDLVLTLDKNIQIMAEAKLEEILKKWHSPAGAIIVEDPRSGEILAMVSSPSFDPNRYSEYRLSDFINPADQELYEPGSSFKLITMAAAVDALAVKPETTYYDNGEVKIAGYTIRNFDEKSHGRQTMRQVLEHSLNTGAIFAQEKTGDDTFLNYVVGFGFGQKTGVDLSGEVSGNISNLYSGRKINFATASFGQGIAVTPLQLTNAYAAIANSGKLMWPHVVKYIIHPDGTKTEIKPKIIGSPIKEETARQLQSMLVDVVDKGFDKARIKGYDIAGKTGTAQIPDPTGGYLENNQFIHNFVGFAPAYAPRFVVLIKMDKPQGIKFAADSLSPVFGDIARFLIRYFNIPPTRK